MNRTKQFILLLRQNPNKMVLFDFVHKHKNYIKDVLPYIDNGIIIDTSVLKIFINGFVNVQISKKTSQEYDDLIKFFELIKINNQWAKVMITHHIFTEICIHIRNNYRMNHNYNEIIKNIIPILVNTKEYNIKKDNILNHIDMKDPIIEIGDISIYLTIKNYEKNGEKICVFEKDGKFLKEYGDETIKNVMVIDYDKVMLDIKEI